MSEAYQGAWLYNIADEMKDSEITLEEGLNAVRRDGMLHVNIIIKYNGNKPHNFWKLAKPQYDCVYIKGRKTDVLSLDL